MCYYTFGISNGTHELAQCTINYFDDPTGKKDRRSSCESHYTAAYEIIGHHIPGYKDFGFTIAVYGPEDTSISFVVDNAQQHGRHLLPCNQMLEIERNVPLPRIGTESTDSSDT